MPWQNLLKDDSLAWLLEPDDPGVRYLALRDLLGRPADDPELAAARGAAHAAGPIAAVLDAMAPAGYWVEPGPGYNPKYRSTVWAIILLAQLGASDRAGRAHRPGVRLSPGSRAGAGRAVQHDRRAVGHGGLPARQPVLGADRAGLRRPAAGKRPSTGWRAP